MTESEWLTTTNPIAMVEFVQNATTSFRTRWLGWLTRKRIVVSERKMRLLGCAIAARVVQLVPEGPIREFQDVVEEWAEGNTTRNVYDTLEWAYADESLLADQEREPRRFAAEAAIANLYLLWTTGDLAPTIRHSILAVALGSPTDETSWQISEAEAASQAELVRCILGNPFAPPRLDPAWLAAHPVLAQIAQSIYADRAFRELPILADALEDAGCVDAAILAHCRCIEPHARGCWVVDLVLSKE